MRFAGTPILSLVWGTPTYSLWIRARAAKGGMIARARAQPGAGSLYRPLPLHGHPGAGAGVRPVVPQRAVLGAAIVPESDGVFAPAEAALEQWIFHVLVEVAQNRVALVNGYADDVARKAAVDIERLLARHRM